MIEIKGVGFHNKGAELMLLAILNEFEKRGKIVEFAVEPFRPFQRRALLGLYQKIWYKRKMIPLDKLFHVFSPNILEDYGIVTSEKVDTILDASGFAYSDQWTVKSIKKTAKMYKDYKQRGKKIILLPQAFGPFNNKEIAQYSSEICEYADLIYARDEVSYDYLLKITNHRDKIRIAPDFTNILNGKQDRNFSELIIGDKKAAIVPNIKMIKKMDSKSAELYIETLKYIIKKLIANNYNPFFLIFESKGDINIAKKLNSEMGLNLSIISQEDSLKSKHIISKCDVVVSSRFHALICSLGQGIPSIALGWSHKYDELFREYNAQKYIISLGEKLDEKYIDDACDFISEKQIAENLTDNYKETSSRINKRINLMWDEVFNFLNI